VIAFFDGARCARMIALGGARDVARSAALGGADDVARSAARMTRRRSAARMTWRARRRLVAPLQSKEQRTDKESN